MAELNPVQRLAQAIANNPSVDTATTKIGDVTAPFSQNVVAPAAGLPGLSFLTQGTRDLENILLQAADRNQTTEGGLTLSNALRAMVEANKLFNPLSIAQQAATTEDLEKEGLLTKEELRRFINLTKG